jgi:hypothetical protein
MSPEFRSRPDISQKVDLRLSVGNSRTRRPLPLSLRSFESYMAASTTGWEMLTSGAAITAMLRNPWILPFFSGRR